MRIVSLAVWSGGPGSGVGRKLLAQAAAWQAAGHDVTLAVLTRDASWRAVACAVPLQVGCWSSRPAIATVWRRLLAGLPPAADVLYLRQGPWLPGLAGRLRRQPAVIEIQTDDLAELARFPLMRWWNRATRARVLGACAGLVAMTPELAALPHYARYRLPSAIIGNPLPLVVPAPHRPSERPRLVMLGTPGQPWHGEDKLPALAAACPEFDIDVIGPAPPSAPGPANLRWHGWLAEDAYRGLLAMASAGLGTLALHRKGMQQACALKVREYLAHGLPVILGHHDPGLPADAPFALSLPNREDNVAGGIAAIRAFVRGWHGRRFDPAQLAHLRSDRIEGERLAFLAEIAGRG